MARSVQLIRDKVDSLPANAVDISGTTEHIS